MNLKSFKREKRLLYFKVNIHSEGNDLSSDDQVKDYVMNSINRNKLQVSCHFPASFQIWSA